MRERYSLENYLKKKEQEFNKLQQEIELLKTAKGPLIIDAYSDSICAYSDNYSLATDFKIRKRRQHISGQSSPEGGYSQDCFETYPQFYFNLESKFKIIPVYIQHKGFDEDKRIVIKSVNITEGTKEYSDMNRRNDNYVNLEEVFNFFKKKGVKNELLKNLEKRIKDSGEF
jgi:hypothetical protein